MATIKQVIARNTGGGSAATRYKKSAKASASAFVDALRKGSSAARRALGLRSAKGKNARNIMRRKSTGGAGG